MYSRSLTTGPRLPCLMWDISGDGPIGPIIPLGPVGPGGPGGPWCPKDPLGPGAPVLDQTKTR